MTTTIAALAVVLIAGGVFLFIARRILRLAIRVALAMALVLTVVAGAGIGWWQGWFGSKSADQRRPQTNQRLNSNRRPR